VRRRILLTLIASTTVAVLALYVPAAIALRQAGQRGDLLELQRAASVVASRTPSDGPVDLDSLTVGLGPDRRVGLYDGDGRLIGGAGPERPDALLSAGLAGRLAEGQVDGDLVAVVPVHIDAGRPGLVVRIEEDDRHSRNRALAATTALGAAALGIIGTAALAGSFLANRLHRPVEALRRWAETDPMDDEPPPTPTGIGELDSLRTTLVDGRHRVVELLGRERAFSARVSHQLRTPVAAMRVAVETELDAPREDPSQILHESLGALDLLESTITSLLALGRNADQPTETVDLARVVGDRAQVWGPRFRETGRDLRTTLPTRSAQTNRPAVEHIIDVLLENALHHGSGTVSVTLGGAEDDLWLEVGDEGSIDPADDPLVNPRTGADRGIGLGLAQSLAESARGRLQLTSGRPTTFRLTLSKREPADDGPLIKR
jgi:signal transduction histidine kinase